MIVPPRRDYQQRYYRENRELILLRRRAAAITRQIEKARWLLGMSYSEWLAMVSDRGPHYKERVDTAGAEMLEGHRRRMAYLESTGLRRMEDELARVKDQICEREATGSPDFHESVS